LPRARQPAKHHSAAPFTDALPNPIFFRVADLPADASYPRHRHLWGEFVYSFSGVMEVKVHDRHYLIPPQYGLWLPPMVEHRGMNRLEANHCSVYVSKELTDRLPQQVCALVVSPLLKALLDDLRQNYPAALPYTGAQNRRLQVLMDELESAQCVGSYLPTSDDALVSPILLALNSAPGTEHTTAQWAKFVHTTERTLMRRFQRELGMTLLEWRQRLRVVKAMPMLQSGMKVENISQDLGYASTSAFIAMFRRMMGVTPDEYRRNLRIRAPVLSSHLS
jgi:AraC-like DNA-binding protein